MAVEKKLIWHPPSTSGKLSKEMWKYIRKARTKKKLQLAIYELAYAMQEMEGKLYELKKFVSKKREY